MSEQKDPRDINEENVSKPVEDISEESSTETPKQEKTSSVTEANSEKGKKVRSASETIENSEKKSA